ncbi:phage portal protein [Lacticaseibacillus parakribbianus]|uniref:phage portal protein n=1 Tax=Lacticaseibacillus parakribbianus TaxID=2970927 RepID=UPI0021CB204A|nr:phage portal protein [Lacticaseibacillus parakribbianus]
MGLISSIKTLADVPNLTVDDADLQRVTAWMSTYQGHPEWSVYNWQDVKGDPHRDALLSLHMPKVSAKKMASLVFNQAATITAYEAGKDPKAGKTTPDDDNNDQNLMLQEILRRNHFKVNLERWLEYCYATGGIMAREYVNDGEVKIRFAAADSIIPISQDANGITECVIASSKVVDGKHYTLLEWHREDERYYIVENQLYRSTSTDGSDLGTRCPLAEVYPQLKEKSLYDKATYTRPTFQYLKPNIANNFNLDSPLGVPIYANAMDTLRMLDEAYNGLMQEMQMGRRRIVAPDYMLKRAPDVRTGKESWYVDWRERVYQPLKMDRTGANKDEVRDITLPLRNDQFIATIKDLLKVYATQIGFSASTFSFDGATGLQTATEVVSQNSETYQTKNSHETLVERFIQDIATSCLELAKNATAVKYSASADVTVMVNFDDSIAKDRDENAKYYQTVTGNKPLMPQREAIKRANGLDDQTADQWLAEIKQEDAGPDDVDDILTQTAGEDNGA